MTEFDLAPDDAQAIEQTLRRFVQERVAPAVERPENVLPSEQLVALTSEALELGFLNLEAEPGFGLWDMPEQPVARGLSLACLRQVAHVNAGIALHFHQLGLGAWLSRKLGVCDGQPTAVDLLGCYGMGRHLLPRLLRGGALDGEARDWLQAYFEPSATCPRLLQLGAPTTHALLARFDADSGAMGFERFALEHLAHERLDTSHGLNETHTLIVPALPAPDKPLHAEGDPTGLFSYREALELLGLGLCAISHGALEHGRDKAAEYAEMRVQGGSHIVHHPAVQQLLGRSHAAIAASEATLGGLTAAALTEDSLERGLAARAALLTEACAAANDALQVFGGSGYMRDNGLEKLVRDQNHLRVFWGTPGDLRRFITELERAA